MKGGIKKWSEALNYSREPLSGCLCLLRQFFWESRRRMRRRRAHSRRSRSSENQSGCSVAALFRINPCLFIWKRPRFFNFPPSLLFHFSWGGLWNCNLGIFKHTHLFWPLVPAITLLLSDRHRQFGSMLHSTALIRSFCWLVKDLHDKLD